MTSRTWPPATPTAAGPTPPRSWTPPSSPPEEAKSKGRPSPAVCWFRRDLRLADNPALWAALAEADDGGVVCVFVVDPALTGPSGASRLAFLDGCLRSVDTSLGGCLTVLLGNPAEEIPRLCRATGAATVVAAADFGPYGRERDRRVAAALEADGRQLLRCGTPYAVAPGTVRTAQRDRFKVFTPFYRAWKDRGWPAPLDAPGELPVAGPARKSWRLPRRALASTDARRPDPGEAAATRALEDFLEPVAGYHDDRNRPDLDRTSGSRLTWTGTKAGPPRSDSRPGRTAAPATPSDAGMRQLRGEAWMHNRMRMIVASFLVKDLHLDWRRGARHFLGLLVDGDLASNQHGWQWTAGTGTDPAPFFRVFNPVRQGRRFDPVGDYVRRWIPELADVAGDAVHEPWNLPGGPPNGYPQPIVDHAVERREALARYGQIHGR